MAANENRKALRYMIREGVRVLCLSASAFLFPTETILASEYFEAPCQEDLREALDNYVLDFEMFPYVWPDKPNLTVRRLGVTHALCIDELISLAGKLDMTGYPNAEKHFIEELVWVKALLDKDLSEIYRQAKYYESLNDKGNGSIIANYLHEWAVEHEYPPAEFDVAQGQAMPDGKPSIRRIRGLAERGYMPAIIDMARRSLTGDGTEKNAGEAWYWLKRAQQENVDTSAVTHIPLQQMLEEMNEQERWTLTYLADYHDDLDMSDMEIPPPFLPLSPNIPPPLTDEEIEAFVAKFGGLGWRADNKSYSIVMRELGARTMGIHYLGNISIDGQIKPLGMEVDEFISRKCNYHHAIDRIFPQDRGELSRQLSAKVEVLSSRHDKGSARYVQDVIQAGKRCPNRDSKAILLGMTWVEGLDQLSPAALRDLAARHIEKSGSVSNDKFEPDTSGSLPINTQGAFWHFMLGKTLQKYAVFKEHGTRQP